MLQLNPRFGQDGFYLPGHNVNEEGGKESNERTVSHKSRSRPHSSKSRKDVKSINDMENGENIPPPPNVPGSIDSALEEELLERERQRKNDDSGFKGCWDTLTGCISSIWYISYIIENKKL